MLDPISSNLLKGAGKHGPIVLMYHSIENVFRKPKWKWAVSRKRFQAQLDLLQAYGWKTTCVRDFLDPGLLDKQTVIITFDDGYADNYWAFKELAKRDMVATWFIVSENIGDNSRWRDGESAARKLLSGTQIQEMNQYGMEIGSHTCNHNVLTDLDNRGLEKEINKSKEQLERLLGDKIYSFAYPYGRYDDRIMEIVKNSGYQLACSCRTGWTSVGFDPFLIRRIAVFNIDNIFSFARKLAFAENNVGLCRVAKYYLSRIQAKMVWQRGGVS